MASTLNNVGAVMVLVYFFFCYAAVRASTTVTAPDMKDPPLLDFGLEHGDTKADFSSLKDQDVELPFNVSYFGSPYTKIYISLDGLMSFQSGMRYLKFVNWKDGVRKENTDKPFLAPFMYDGMKEFDIPGVEYKGAIYYRVMEEGNLQTGTKYHHEQVNTLKWLGQYVQETTLNMGAGFQADLAVVVTWDQVTYNSADEDEIRSCNNSPKSCKTATFQVVLVADRTLGRTVAILNYFKMDIPVKSSYQAGFNGGNGRYWFDLIPCHGSCGDSYLENLPALKGSDVTGRFIVDVGSETVVRGGCLPDEFSSGILEVYPREVGMFGGENLEVSGKCRPRSSKIFCRFGNEDTERPVTEGIMINEMKGFCPVPRMTTKGNIVVAWSPKEGDDSWATDRKISVIHPSRVEPTVAVPKNVMNAWFSRDASEITVVWDPEKFTHIDAKADIRLVGYRETNDKVEYKSLDLIGHGSIQKGSYTFNVADHRCKQNCLEFEQGLLEVALPAEYLGVAKERVAVRHGPIPLGWYVNEKMTEDNGTKWSDQMCRTWNAEDSKHTDWLSSLLPCPCSLDQALADFGRFQPDAGCNLFDGSKCTYHKQAKHCVRAVVPTPEGSGNQCCYSNSGLLVYSQLSYQGSTPDRSHDWGAAPYGRPDLVPSLSHWKHDVVTFYYCCLWNNYDLCDLYMERRPTQDCKAYDVPAVATIRGVSHVSTFDGLDYQMLGVGDFYLLKTAKIEIQGRFAARRGAYDLGTQSGGTKSWSASVLKAVALLYNGIFVDLSLAPENADPARGIDVRVSNKVYYFNTKSTMWQDFKGFSIVNNALPGAPNLHNNFTLLFSNNIGVNVVAQNGLMHATVALPPDMKKSAGEAKGMGLLGTYDGNSGNDFMSKSDSVTAPGSNPDNLLDDFVLSWDIEKERDTLFPFFEAASPVDRDHLYFRYDDIPSQFSGAPSEDDIDQVCGSESNCKWDYRLTGSPEVAQATKAADKLFSYVQKSVMQVDNCGLPDVGRNAKMDSYDFSVGSKITVTGCKEGVSFSGAQEYKCVKEPMSEAEKENREDYGLIKTDKDDGVEYIIHWLPKPDVLCGDSAVGGGLDLMWIIVIAVSAVVLLAIIIIIIVVVLKRRNNSDKYSSQNRPKPANRRTGGDNRDDKSGQAMLPREDDRRPVYKPSREPVQIQGSTV